MLPHLLGLANKPLFNNTFFGIALSQVSIANDLGIIFDSKFDFSHCHKVAAKGFARVNMLLKYFYSKYRSLQCKLFSTFIRLILEFNSSIWSPHLAKNIIAIEWVQKYFTKNLKGLGNKPYKERLAILNLSSLECLRAFINLIFLNKIMHHFSDNKLKHLFLHTILRTPKLLHRHPHQFDLPKPRLDLLKLVFVIEQLNFETSC